MSHVTRHTSHVTRHTSHVTRLISIILAWAGMSTIARAGHYSVGTTSGLTASPSASLVFGAGSASASPGVGGTGAATIGGTITTPIAWVKDKDSNGNEIAGDIAPDQAIVIETCNVSASGYCFPGGSPSASANNGLGTTWSTNVPGVTKDYFTTIPYPPFQVKIGNYQISTSGGSKAQIKLGATFNVTCSVSGSGS